MLSRVRMLVVLGTVGACLVISPPPASSADPPPVAGIAAAITATPARMPATPGPQPASASSTGHIDSTTFARATPGYGTLAAPDNIAFTTDPVVGLVIFVSGAAVHDQWSWRLFWPGTFFPVVNCYARIAAPGDPNNTSGTTALVSDCTGSGPQVKHTFSAGCPCDFEFGGGVSVSSTVARQHTGIWSVFVDYSDHDGSGITGLVSTTFDLQPAPLIAVLHGWENNCTQTMTLIVDDLRSSLAIPDSFVQCHDYNSRDGVKSAACGRSSGGFGPFLQNMKAADPDQPNIVHIVAHSMGGLVARYYAEQCHGADDPEVGSIAMLGTPNEGVFIAGLLRQLCSWHALFHPLQLGGCVAVNIGGRFAGVDLHSDGVKDLAPGSKIIKKLDSAALPPGIAYRAHIGLVNTLGGLFTSLDRENDCFIGASSVRGNAREFQPFEQTYDSLSHAIVSVPFIGSGCNAPTLLDGTGTPLIANIVTDIKAHPFGNASGGGAAVPLALTPAAAGRGTPLLAADAGVAELGQAADNQLTLPAGLDDVTIALFWADADTPPDLGLTLRRPDGTVVTGGDPGVSGDIALNGGSAFFMRSHGFEITSPAGGTWTASVTGNSVPAEGTPYMVLAIPSGGVAADLTVAQPLIAQGSNQTFTASLDDNGTLVAPATITASVIVLDGTSQPVTLHDDGLSGDAAAGDFVYSGSIDTTGGCGTYRISVTATGSTSEGSVTREQLDSYDVSVPGDAVRDPCNPDEDQDGLTDDAELNTYHTDPLTADTDGDGLDDGAEVNTYGTSPLLADTDGDTLSDGAEVNTYGTNPLLADTDGDNCGDGKELGTSKVLGGQRNPLDPYDFYDVPYPALLLNPAGTRDGGVGTTTDGGALLKYAGLTSTSPDYIADRDGNGVEDGLQYDRSIAPGQPPFPPGPPDGGIGITSDFLAMNAQFGNTCVGS